MMQAILKIKPLRCQDSKEDEIPMVARYLNVILALQTGASIVSLFDQGNIPSTTKPRIFPVTSSDEPILEYVYESLYDASVKGEPKVTILVLALLLKKLELSYQFFSPFTNLTFLIPSANVRKEFFTKLENECNLHL